MLTRRTPPAPPARAPATAAAPAPARPRSPVKTAPAVSAPAVAAPAAAAPAPAVSPAPTPTATRAAAAPTTPAPASSLRAGGPPLVRLAPGPPAASGGGLPAAAEAIVRSPGAGAPIPAGTLRALNRTFDLDLSGVRVHSGGAVARAVAALGARAFTYGMHIFLGRGEQPADLGLMAHEAAHVVQQQGAPVFQMYSAAGADRFEHEAARAEHAARQGGQMTVSERTGGARVQRQGLLEQGEAWLRDQVMGLLEEHAPALVPILRQGVVEWLKEKLGGALRALMDSLTGPVRSIRDVASAVRLHFGRLVAWLREAGAKILRNDCAPISEAADKIYQVFEGLAAPVIDRVKHYVNVVKDFFQGLWDRFGAPVWELLRSIGGAIWEEIQRVGRWIWEKTQPIRDWLNRAWVWFKNWLGIGEGEEGQNGILQWFQRKAGEAWAWVSERIAPFKRHLLILVGVLVLLSPAGPYIVIAGVVAGVARGLMWIRQYLRNRQAVVQQQSILRGVILPAILRTIGTVSGVIQTIAGRLTGALIGAVAALHGLVAIIADTPLVSFAAGLARGIVGVFQGLLDWAVEGVQGAAGLIQSALQRLGGFAQTVVSFLETVQRVQASILRNFYQLGGRIWNAIPACIRDPFIDYFIPLILGQISFFRELVGTPEAWQRTRAEVMTLIRQVFRDFDLMGAIRSAFRLVVRALRIPIDLAGQVIEKAAQAWDLVVARPLQFIENALKAVLRGVGRFILNILSHLWYGIQGWLLNQITDTGITPPSSWFDLGEVIRFVLSILGISRAHIFQLLRRRLSSQVVDRLEGALDFLTGVWEFVRVALTEGPRGLWRLIVDRLRDIGNVILQSAVNWVMTRIVAIVSARLSALAASAGWSAILEAVYAVWQAIQTAIEYARRILEIMLTIFTTIVQIAQGTIDPAAAMLERGLRMAMPIVIGFLANYAGLGGIGGRIREIVEGIRTRVDNAILALIDRALAAGRAVLDLIMRGVRAVRNWWQMRKQFTSEQGEPHEIYFVGARASARLMVASFTPQAVSQLVSERLAIPASDPNAPTSAERAELRAAERVLTTLNSRMGQAEAAGSTDPVVADIDRLLETLKGHLSRGGIDKAHGDVPLSRVTFSTVATNKAGQVAANPLTKRSGNTEGDSNTANNEPAWTAVLQAKAAARASGNTVDLSRLNVWVQMHLLSHQLHGPGNPWNLVVTQSGQNTGWVLRDFETPMQGALRRNLTFRLTIDVRYWPADPAKPYVADFPRFVIYTWQELNNKTLAGSRLSLPSGTLGGDKELPKPDFAPGGKADLSRDNKALVVVVLGGSTMLGNRVVDNQPYASFDDFMDKMVNAFKFGPEDFEYLIPRLVNNADQFVIQGAALTPDQLEILTAMYQLYTSRGRRKVLRWREEVAAFRRGVPT